MVFASNNSFRRMQKWCLPSQGIGIHTNSPREHFEDFLFRTGKLRKRQLTVDEVPMKLMWEPPRTIGRPQVAFEPTRHALRQVSRNRKTPGSFPPGAWIKQP
jgi:hypothetical protein